MKRIRAERAREETLDWVPPWLGQRMLELSASSTPRACVLVPLVPPGPARRRRPGARRPRPAADDQGDVQDDRRALGRLDALAVPDACAGRGSSTRTSTPTRRSSASGSDVAHVCRLDEPDPAQAWHDRIEQIFQVAGRLDALDLDALHFEGPGTDLTVGLLPRSRFAKEGGSSQTRTGVRHVPNIPTEEVYTTPDPERTQGVVTATKPLDVAGSLVTGLRVRFEGGRAVEIDADANADALRQRCAVDEGASRLGEVALVDRESRIGQLGRTFFTTLLDENAASHLALGDAYSAPIGDDADLPRINASAVHIDFMIGSRRRRASPARRRRATACRSCAAAPGRSRSQGSSGRSSGSVRASIASCAASSESSGTSTVSGSSSPSVPISASMPAFCSSSWSSSASAGSPATATCTIRAIAGR